MPCAIERSARRLTRDQRGVCIITDEYAHSSIDAGGMGAERHERRIVVGGAFCEEPAIALVRADSIHPHRNAVARSLVVGKPVWRRAYWSVQLNSSPMPCSP